MSELERFLASRDPDVVSREWTSSSFEDARIEGLSRGAGRARMERLMRVEGLLPPETCVHGHPISEMSYRLSAARKVTRHCRACAREAGRIHRAYMKELESRGK